jgi:hypothetical protein
MKDTHKIYKPIYEEMRERNETLILTQGTNPTVIGITRLPIIYQAVINIQAYISIILKTYVY